jgi:hypothetical protein
MPAQRIQAQSLPAGFDVFLNSSAGVATIVVYGQMQLSVAAVDPSLSSFKSFKNSSSFLRGPLTQ